MNITSNLEMQNVTATFVLQLSRND